MKMKRNFSFMRISLLLTALILALALISCGGCGGGEGLEPGQVSVRINDSAEIEIRAAFSEAVLASAGKQVYLFELSAGVSTPDLNTMKPVAKADASKNVRFTLSMDHGGASRVYYGFFLAFYNENTNAYVPAIERPVYVENPESIAVNDYTVSDTSSMKGLADPGVTASVELGISHALVELPIEKYLLAQGSADAYCHIFGGESFFFNEDAIEELDEKLCDYTELGLNVFLRVTLGSAGYDIPEGLEYLGYADAPRGEDHYGINFGNERAMASYAAFVDLLGSRYAQTGVALNLLVGRGANSPECTVSDAYLVSYEHALRVSHLIMRSYASGATVYAAVDSNLNTQSSFISRLAAIAAAGGNYGFGIAAELSAGSDRVWYGSPNSTELIPTNLYELTDLLGSDALIFDGEVRPTVISDFSIVADRDATALANQAASYAFTYYKLAENGMIDVLIYSSLQDGESADGLMTEGGDKKNVYGIFAAVDTEKEIGVTVSQVINSSAWTDLYGNEELRDTVTRGKSYTGKLKLDSAENYECTPVFSVGDESFKMFGLTGDGYLGISRKDGVSSFYAEFSGGAAGVTFGPIAADRLAGKYLIIPMRFDGEGQGELEFTLTLTQNDHDGELRSCSATGKLASGADHTVVFDISSLTSDKLEEDAVLSVYVSESAAFRLTLGAFLSGNEPPSVWMIILIVALCVMAAAGITVLLVLWFKKIYSVKKAEGGEEVKEDGKTEKSEKTDSPEREKVMTVYDIKNRHISSRTSQQTASRTSQQTSQQAAQNTASRSAFNTSQRPAQNTVRQAAVSNTASRPAQKDESDGKEEKKQD